MRRLHRTARQRCPPFSPLICLCVGSIVIFIAFLTLRSKPSVCSTDSFQLEIVDRFDAWRYQNSLTGQWYPWRTISKTSIGTPKWSVKWLNTVPKSSLGVVVYLSTRNELASLNRSLGQLNRLLVTAARPVVIFHEGDLANDSLQQSLARTLGSRMPLGFERIDISANSHQPQSVHRRYPRSYFAMCRFFTLMLSTHPLLTLFNYYWRLDSHSYVFAPQPIEDPFELMQRRQIQYAFIMTNEEGEPYVTGLWKLFHDFLDRHCLKPSAGLRQTQTSWFGRYSFDIIFTNFAIANVSLWRENPMIQAWLQLVDRHGGIYRHRWGDAPIHTLALTQFLAREQIARLRYFGYFHRREYVCARETDEAVVCERQAQVFFTDPHVRYLRYDDGCFLSRAPLCHYYREITN